MSIRAARVCVWIALASGGVARAEDPGKGTPASAESPPVPLADAVKDLKGKGPLVARIDVETKDVKGTFTCTLYEDKAPVTVANFVALARGLRPWKPGRTGTFQKKPLYDGTLVHRVVPDYLIQGGDPMGTGRGWPGYYFDDEIKSDLMFDRPGVLAMANKGIDRATGHGTNGSQFFITEKETPWLNGQNTIFGRCEPLDLAQRIARVPTNPGSERPAVDVVIKKVTIQRGLATKKAGEKGERSVEKAAPKAIEKKPIEKKPAEKPVQTDERPVEKAAEKPVEKAAEPTP